MLGQVLPQDVGDFLHNADTGSWDFIKPLFVDLLAVVLGAAVLVGVFNIALRLTGLMSGNIGKAKYIGVQVAMILIAIVLALKFKPLMLGVLNFFGVN